VLITRQELEIHRMVVSKVYALGELKVEWGGFRQIAPLNLDVVADLLGEEIHIRGRLGTQLSACCDRCLADVQLPVDWQFDLYYRPMTEIAKEEEIEIPKEELDVGFYPETGILLEDVATEQVILALPMKVVCQENCLGLCPTCGVNRNVEKCKCPPPPTGSPFAALKGL
jgi:uncharacterized protein